jgi:hypothetical protein
MGTLPSPEEPSRLFYYGTCRTPIHSLLWDRHLKTLRILERQATALGMWEVAYELSLLIARHISAQLKAEMEHKNGT